MVRLYYGRRAAEGRNTFNYVRVKSALGKKLCAEFPGFFFKYIDKGAADYFSFFLRVGNAFKPFDKKVSSVNVFQVNSFPESLHDFFRLSFPQNSVVNKNAQRFFAACPVQNDGEAGGINAAAHSAYNFFGTDLLTYFSFCLFKHGFRIPLRFEAAYPVKEVFEN